MASPLCLASRHLKILASRTTFKNFIKSNSPKALTFCSIVSGILASSFLVGESYHHICCTSCNSNHNKYNITSGKLKNMRKDWDDHMIDTMILEENGDDDDFSTLGTQEENGVLLLPLKNTTTSTYNSHKNERDRENILFSKDSSRVISNFDHNNNDQDLDSDEPTTCTICLVNRKGPCRYQWRKFERCMKDNLKSNDDLVNSNDINKYDKNNEEGTKSVKEDCDLHMLPWLTCVQSYRNIYTLITNKLYQDMFIDNIEKNIDEKNKVYFGDVNPLKFLDINRLAYYVNRKECFHETLSTANKASNMKPHLKDRNDTDLVSAFVSINLIDSFSGKEIDIAYVRDQDGKILGFEQFSSIKKEREERLNNQRQNDNSDSQQNLTQVNSQYNTSTNENKNDDIINYPYFNKTKEESNIGKLAFYISPETTDSIQVFALYKKNSNSKFESNRVATINLLPGKEEKKRKEIVEEEGASKSDETLYYSSIISLDHIKLSNLRE